MVERTFRDTGWPLTFDFFSLFLRSFTGFAIEQHLPAPIPIAALHSRRKSLFHTGSRYRPRHIPGPDHQRMVVPCQRVSCRASIPIPALAGRETFSFLPPISTFPDMTASPFFACFTPQLFPILPSRLPPARFLRSTSHGRSRHCTTSSSRSSLPAYKLPLHPSLLVLSLSLPASSPPSLFRHSPPKRWRDPPPLGRSRPAHRELRGRPDRFGRGRCGRATRGEEGTSFQERGGGCVDWLAGRALARSWVGDEQVLAEERGAS